jgi:hypothetical protein
MKQSTLFKAGSRAKVVQIEGEFVRELVARGFHHCGELRPIVPVPSCRFCGEDCGGFH